jgi:hypothetical protein
MNTEDNDIKFKALEQSVYCPPYKEENAIETIILDDEFDVEKAKAGVRDSVALLSYQRSYRPLIIEILDILDQNTAHFLVDKQKYISFYWSGILVLQIVTKNEDSGHGKQLHVSLQKYKVEKERLEDKQEKEQLNNKMMLFGFGGSLIVAGGVAAYAFFKKN